MLHPSSVHPGVPQSSVAHRQRRIEDAQDKPGDPVALQALLVLSRVFWSWPLVCVLEVGMAAGA